MPDGTPGLINLWISEIKGVRDRHAALLHEAADDAERWNRRALTPLPEFAVFGLEGTSLGQHRVRAGEGDAAHTEQTSQPPVVFSVCLPPTTLLGLPGERMVSHRCALLRLA